VLFDVLQEMKKSSVIPICGLFVLFPIFYLWVLSFFGFGAIVYGMPFPETWGDASPRYDWALGVEAGSATLLRAPQTQISNPGWRCNFHRFEPGGIVGDGVPWAAAIIGGFAIGYTGDEDPFYGHFNVWVFRIPIWLVAALTTIVFWLVHKHFSRKWQRTQSSLEQKIEQEAEQDSGGNGG
jgi:hypothetical protein